MTQRIFHFLEERLVDESSLQGLADGVHQVKVTPGGAKVQVHIVNGTISSYEAQDEAGNPVLLFFIRERRPISSPEQFSFTHKYEDVCYSCAGGGFSGGEVYCYGGECIDEHPKM